MFQFKHFQRNTWFDSHQLIKKLESARVFIWVFELIIKYTKKEVEPLNINLGFRYLLLFFFCCISGFTLDWKIWIHIFWSSIFRETFTFSIEFFCESNQSESFYLLVILILKKNQSIKFEWLYAMFAFEAIGH